MVLRDSQQSNFVKESPGLLFVRTIPTFEFSSALHASRTLVTYIISLFCSIRVNFVIMSKSDFESVSIVSGLERLRIISKLVRNVKEWSKSSSK